MFTLVLSRRLRTSVSPTEAEKYWLGKMTSVEEFNCLFCQDSFDSKEELQIHFRKHGDPKFNQNVKGKPQAEMAASGDKVEEGEVVNCDVCEEVFPTISKAITHKHKMHPDQDTKYFCPWCGKLFTMKHLYNKHIRSTHDSKDESGVSAFHCDYCEVDFFVPSAMVYHNKFFHRQDTELAAIGHSKKLKMFNQEPLQIYYCPFCGEEYYNKVNLHKHMGDDHIDENQTPEDVLRCSLCEAVFYHLDAYELHLTFHSSDDQYTEDNELIKGITEFSLETVPPMMEKVENESQDDEPTGSMGIEELLQQGMNESNDYDTCDEPRKKKKHKKHKKSKKTITLDEFLNMHSDVLGEDLDVQGIVEVPSQVVTKQLRKPQPQKIKPGPKAVPSAELAKLKKAGIVIKKKPTSFQGIKIATRKPVINKAQMGKVIPPIQMKSDIKSSSNEILSKLLNQSNSEIKIVKKSTDSDPGMGSLSNNESQYEDTEKAIEGSIEEKENGNINSIKKKLNEPYENNLKEFSKNDIESNVYSTHDKSSQESDDMCSTENCANIDQVTKETKRVNETLSEEDADKEEPLRSDNNKECIQLHVTNVTKPTVHGIDAINALKNIGQHITIKSVSTSNSSQIEQKSPVPDFTASDTSKHQEDYETNTSLIDDPPKCSNRHPLNALKHLSHLTVKSANESKITTLPTQKEDIDKKTTIHQDNLDDMDIDEEFENESHKVNTSNVNDIKDTKITATNFDALKSLSKHITVKTMHPSPKITKNLSENQQRSQDIHEEHDVDDLNVSNNNKIENKRNVFNKQSAIKNVNNLKSPGTKLSSSNLSPKVQNWQPESEVQNQNNQIVLHNPKAPANADILKQLPNITAKPINSAKNLTQKVTTHSLTESTNIQIGNTSSQSSLKRTEMKQNEIEIFNIEDSDDEDITLQDLTKNQQSTKPISTTTKVADTNIQEKSMEVLKNLSKHITVKPRHQPKSSKQENFEDHNDTFEDDPFSDDYNSECDESLPQKSLENQLNTLLKKKLKSLGNITMKSRNPSPKNLASAHSSPKVKNNAQVEEFDSDPDNFSKVKITELPDDYTSDDDFSVQKNKKAHNEANHDIVSDSDAHIEDDDDIESLKKPTTLRKNTPNINKTPTCLNSLKNLTVKSLKENNVDQEDEEIPENVHNDNPINQNKQLSKQPFKQNVPIDDNQEGATIPVRQQIRQAINKNASTSSNQLNTVNKEVTVQTFQTKTVIEEITTTVTKTIRTVSQSTKQEVQNVSQNTSTPIRPQRIQGIRPNQQIKNFQGMSVRQATPIRPRMRNPAMPTRPPGGANIRPSSQLVRVRPGVNVASNPRMTVVTNNPSSSTSTSHKPVVGRPLKISPNAIAPATKRPTSEESTGPFSCFKKPKESLIPGTSNFTDNEGDSAVQCMSSHVSRSNFVSMTKSVKGNSLVTSTQTKSELSASAEQLNRLNSMSGLKIVKTSQMKQASKVEERVEISPVNQRALSAIEKLQKQGLLVKKPRTEEPEDSDHSNPDEDDDYYDT